MVRDWKGDVMFYDAKRICYGSPMEIEVKDLSWVAEVAERRLWRALYWSLDCREDVNDILSMEDPMVWETRYDIIFLRFIFENENR